MRVIGHTPLTVGRCPTIVLYPWVRRGRPKAVYCELLRARTFRSRVLSDSSRAASAAIRSPINVCLPEQSGSLPNLGYVQVWSFTLQERWPLDLPRRFECELCPMPEGLR